MYRSVLKNFLSKQSYSQCAKRFHTPRRALLYVPGSDQKKISKISSLNVDCAVLDCEDGVAVNKKDVAREHICSALNQMKFEGGEICVRINSINSEFCQHDLNAVLNNKILPTTIVIPKVESKDHVKWFSNELKKNVSSFNGHKFRLIFMVESAKSLLDFREICKEGFNQAITSPMTVDGVIFGSDDFCADIGATRTPNARELMYARQKIVATAKLFRIQAIDLVHINYKDLDGLKLASEESARMGFTGKQVIHPSQIPVVQKAYSPSNEQISWAEELVKAFEEQEKEGKGAIVFNGNMIDMPLVLQAKNILQTAKTIIIKD